MLPKHAIWEANILLVLNQSFRGDRNGLINYVEPLVAAG